MGGSFLFHAESAGADPLAQPRWPCWWPEWRGSGGPCSPAGWLDSNPRRSRAPGERRQKLPGFLGLTGTGTPVFYSQSKSQDPADVRGCMRSSYPNPGPHILTKPGGKAGFESGSSPSHASHALSPGCCTGCMLSWRPSSSLDFTDWPNFRPSIRRPHTTWETFPSSRILPCIHRAASTSLITLHCHCCSPTSLSSQNASLHLAPRATPGTRQVLWGYLPSEGIQKRACCFYTTSEHLPHEHRTCHGPSDRA